MLKGMDGGCLFLKGGGDGGNSVPLKCRGTCLVSNILWLHIFIHSFMELLSYM